MKITVSGKQMTVRQSLKDLTEKKLAKFDRFFGDDAEADVVYSCRHDLQYVEITIVYGGTIFRSEEGADTFQSAIERAIDTLERQIRKNKTRLEKRLRQGAFERVVAEDAEDEVASFAPDEPEELEYDLARTKKFPIKPMTKDEAILQMNLLDHTFFAFKDEDADGAFAVVYRRKDGGYGLIEDET